MSNAVWFYTDAARQQQGPVDEAGLQQLWREGRIDGRTLVWREGQRQWVALSGLAPAMPWLGALAAMSPPPLPPAFDTTSAPVGPRRKTSGCLIALAVAAVVSIPLLGILAAIALPAYQDYTQRARLSEVLIAANALKLEVDQAFVSGEGCPQARDIGDGARSPLFQSAWIGPFENGHCGIELMVADTPMLTRFAGKKIWLWREDAQSQWRCSSEIADRFLPIGCRD